jgi:hypothetical protein
LSLFRPKVISKSEKIKTFVEVAEKNKSCDRYRQFLALYVGTATTVNLNLIASVRAVRVAAQQCF